MLRKTIYIVLSIIIVVECMLISFIVVHSFQTIDSDWITVQLDEKNDVKLKYKFEILGQLLETNIEPMFLIYKYEDKNETIENKIQISYFYTHSSNLRKEQFIREMNLSFYITDRDELHACVSRKEKVLNNVFITKIYEEIILNNIPKRNCIIVESSEDVLIMNKKKGEWNNEEDGVEKFYDYKIEN